MIPVATAGDGTPDGADSRATLSVIMVMTTRNTICVGSR
jgi:hypothetical protein